MKTKIASFLTAAVVSLLTLATSSFADAGDGFYDKEHIRGFVSFGGDYRGMRAEFQKYVNRTAFITGTFVDPADSSGAGTTPDSKPTYNQFSDYYLGLHLNAGAQYKQFLTWLDFNFMPTQFLNAPPAPLPQVPVPSPCSTSDGTPTAPTGCSVGRFLAKTISST